MRYRAFGRTGWQISEIGFGAWQLGGDWGQVDDKASIDTLHYAFGKGINFVDTAELYGNGHSEEVISRDLKQWTGDKIYVATKTRPIIWPEACGDVGCGGDCGILLGGHTCDLAIAVACDRDNAA